MNNAEKFKQIFGLYATEVWSMPESDFLAWLNRDVEIAQNVQNEDLIQRKAAIEMLNDIPLRGMKQEGKYLLALVSLPQVLNVLEQLPSAQPEPKWIPCSERLPENDNEVLITVWDAEDDYVEVYKGFYQGHEWWTQWCHGCSKIKDEPCGENIVIAWMPLPEPYQEGGE